MYFVILEKPGHKSRAGVGSAACQESGARSRVKNYQDNYVCKFSKYTRSSIQEGFEMTHLALIAAIPIPPLELRPLGRAWILTLEGVFTWKLWTLYRGPNRKNGQGFEYMRHVCPWDIEDLDWDGLNSYSPLRDGVDSIELTMEELQAKEARRKEIAREHRRIWEQIPDNKARLKEIHARYNKSDRGRAVARAFYHRNKAANTAWFVQKKAAEKERRETEESKARRRELYHQNKDGGWVHARKQVLDTSFEALRRVEVGELDEDDEEVQELIKPAVNKRASRNKYNQKRINTLSESRAVLRRVKAGELDGEDEEVKQQIQLAVEKNEYFKTWAANERAAKKTATPGKVTQTKTKATMSGRITKACKK